MKQHLRQPELYFDIMHGNMRRPHIMSSLLLDFMLMYSSHRKKGKEGRREGKEGRTEATERKREETEGRREGTE